MKFLFQLLGMIVTSFQDFKLRGKQISRSFSYCQLMYSPRNGTKVSCLSENKKMSKYRDISSTAEMVTVMWLC